MAEEMEDEALLAPVEGAAPVQAPAAAGPQPKMLNMKASDFLEGGLSIGAVVEADFASAWEPFAFKQWVAHDPGVKARIAASESYTMDHMRIALESCIPKTYLDEYQGMGKNNTDIKVAVAWFPNGDAMRFAAEILTGHATVTTINGNKMTLVWTRLDKLLGDALRFYEGETVTAAGREERRANAETTVYFMENVNLGHGSSNMQNAVMAMQGLIADHLEYGGKDKKTQYRKLLSYAPKHEYDEEAGKFDKRRPTGRIIFRVSGPPIKPFPEAVKFTEWANGVAFDVMKVTARGHVGVDGFAFCRECGVVGCISKPDPKLGAAGKARAAMTDKCPGRMKLERKQKARKIEAAREEKLEAPSVREHYMAVLVAAANEMIGQAAGGKAVRPPKGIVFSSNPCPTWAGKGFGAVGKPIGQYCNAGCRLLPCVASTRKGELLHAAAKRAKREALATVAEDGELDE